VQGVAVVAGNVVLPVLACVPEGKVAVAFVARQADTGFSIGGNRLVAESEDAADPAPAPGLDMRFSIAVTGLAVRAPYIARLAVPVGEVALDVVGMATLADLYDVAARGELCFGDSQRDDAGGRQDQGSYREKKVALP